MSKEIPNKQKNIDDVLLSIDSLLDTASGVEPGETAESSDKPISKATATGNATKRPLVSEEPLKSKPRPKNPTKSLQKKSARIKKAPHCDNRSLANEESVKTQTASTQATVPEDKPETKAQASLAKAPVQTDKHAADRLEAEKEPGQPAGSEEDLCNDAAHVDDIDDEPSNPLSFTTVDDDLSQAMRELPVLDEIVTIEDLAYIGSGKEPPKKILTEAYKRLSLTDKLIEILKNQLSDYNISKLEYKYLHELIEELLEKENKNKKS